MRRCLPPLARRHCSESLKPDYGSRFNTGFAVYLTLRPGARQN